MNDLSEKQLRDLAHQPVSVAFKVECCMGDINELLEFMIAKGYSVPEMHVTDQKPSN
jgi:hypothetical protein